MTLDPITDSDGRFDADRQRFEAWLLERCPIDLGDSNHRVGWQGEPGKSDLWWLHRCPEHHVDNALGTIDVTSGTRHRLVAITPVSIHESDSVLCGGCGDHGYVRDGHWVAA